MLINGNTVKDQPCTCAESAQSELTASGDSDESEDRHLERRVCPAPNIRLRCEERVKKEGEAEWDVQQLNASIQALSSCRGKSVP